jgi:amino acid adenylation domain-containing protein
MSRNQPTGFEFSNAKRALLSALLRDEGLRNNSDQAKIIPRRTGEGPIPLSCAQERLWFLAQLGPEDSSYNLTTAIRLRGDLEVNALEWGLSEISRRHEVLRTTFTAVAGQSRQIIARAESMTLPVTDLQNLPEAEQETEIRRLVRAEARRPFDLQAGPLWRVHLFRLAGRSHVLLISMHHIVTDGWSQGVFVRELAALYAACSNSRSASLPALPIQYADFAVWQRQRLQGHALDEQLAYWKRQLAELPALALPTDHSRPAVSHFACGTQSFLLPPSLSAELKALSRREGVTLFMTLLAAFQVLLGRYCGQEDIALGTPVSNRGRPELEGLIGFFVNTLVLRTKLSGNPTFRELLRRVQEMSLAAFAHQDMPFEKLVAELRPERNLSRNPLFQVLFVFQNAPQETLRFSGLELSYLDAETTTTPFDLVVGLMEEADGISGALEFRTELFEPAAIARLAEHYRQLLTSLAASPDNRIDNLPLLTPAERHTLLVEWNRTQAAQPRGRCIHELISEQATRTPDALAVVGEVQCLTYQELDEQANRLAYALRRAGLKAEARVGVCLERSPQLLVALLAVLKAGGAYVPIDPAYPKERLALLLDDAKAALMLTQQRLRERLPSYPGRVLFLDGTAEAASAAAAPEASAKCRPDQLAYVIYTSGSTGRPKGVAVQHGHLVASTWARLHYYDAAASARDQLQRRFLLLSSYAFDSSVAGIFGTLCQGGCLLVPPEGTERDPAQVIEWIARHGITDTLCVPSLYELLLTQAPPTRLASLRRVVVAGEECPTALVRRHQQLLPQARLFNEYGPTEATVWSTVQECSDIEASSRVPIGQAIANAQVYVLDRWLNPVPVGVPGELYIGGLGVARGYLHKPDLTAERFLPDPFSRVPGARFYKTGDRARWRADASLEFLGRIDQQIKLRGFRIEPGEIEAVLHEHPDVRAAAVLAREDAPGVKRLVAYLVLHPGASPSVAKLREFLRGRLPVHLIPAAFVCLDALPLAPNGKLDREALPPPGASGLEPGGVHVPPRGLVEGLLAAIWCDVLTLERVGRHDNFFDLGGHSLLATQVASRVRQLLQIDLPLRVLFERPTLAELGARIEETRRAGSKGQPPLRPAPRNRPLPMSFAQQRLWLFEQLQPGNSVYNQADAVRILGELDRSALERSLAEIVRRHEVLRTRFTIVAGEPVQVIDPFQTVPLPVTDLRHLCRADREAEVQRRSAAEAERAFDLQRGPLLRSHLLRLDDCEYVLLLARHHIVADGWSMGVYVRELAVLYTAFRQGHPSPLPAMPLQYADFAVWQRRWLQGEVLEQELRYWESRLGGMPELSLPTDRPRPSVRRFHGSSVTFELPSDLTAALRKLSRREGATLFMALLAAFQVLLARLTGQDDIAVGTPIANRNRRECEGLIGFFVNTLVLRTDLSGKPTFRELLARVRDVALGVYDHQDLPFEKLVEHLRPPRDPSRHPLFQVMFVLQNTPRTSVELPGLRLEDIPSDEGMALFDLTLTVGESDDRLSAILEYDEDLFERRTICRIAEDYRRLLEDIVADPGMRIEQFLQPSSTHGELTATARPMLHGVERTGIDSTPRTAVEKQLAEIWRSLLAVERVGVHDNFFELGGHSLLAAQMLFRAQCLFEQRLSLGAFSQNPTISQVAQALTNGPASRSSILLPFRSQGTKIPLFCVHPLGGSGSCYFSLSHHFDAEQPFYAIRAPELDGEREPLDRIEDMAASYIDAILGVRSRGPYLLGGWSLGGVIAFEMARQLRARGMPVALVALLDTQPPGASASSSSLSNGEATGRSGGEDDANLLAEIASDLDIRISRKVLRRLEPSERLDYVVRQAAGQQGEADIVRRTVSRDFAVCKAQKCALAAYHPEIYQGSVTLFRCTARRSPRRNDQLGGWERLAAGGVQVHVVPGSHQTMIAEPRVRILARKLQACIDAAFATG